MEEVERRLLIVDGDAQPEFRSFAGLDELAFF